MKKAGVLLALLAMACSASGKKPVGSLELSVSPEQTKESLTSIRSYANSHEFEVVERRFEKDGRQITLMELKRRGCLAITVDNAMKEDALALFFFECPRVDWRDDYDSLKRSLGSRVQ